MTFSAPSRIRPFFFRLARMYLGPLVSKTFFNPLGVMPPSGNISWEATLPSPETLFLSQFGQWKAGLDQRKVRVWNGWCRHTTLAMPAHAYLALVRRQANECSGGKEGESRNGMKP